MGGCGVTSNLGGGKMKDDELRREVGRVVFKDTSWLVSSDDGGSGGGRRREEFVW